MTRCETLAMSMSVFVNWRTNRKVQVESTRHARGQRADRRREVDRLFYWAQTGHGRWVGSKVDDEEGEFGE